MKPYYDEGGITIYHGDCREVLAGTEVIADLVLTDPPYNVGVDYGRGTDDSRGDYEAWCRDWFAVCRCLSPVVAISTGVANLGLWDRICPPTWVIAWHKPAAMGRCTLGFNNWEPVMVWGRPQGITSNDVVVAPVVTDPSLAGEHPCPKPLKWASGLLLRLCDRGGMVLDPFMGSGTTLRAAKDSGLRAVGIDVEERYCELAAQRLGQEVFDLESAA